jgi:hypothetical protein
MVVSFVIGGPRAVLDSFAFALTLPISARLRADTHTAIAVTHEAWRLAAFLEFIEKGARKILGAAELRYGERLLYSAFLIE